MARFIKFAHTASRPALLLLSTGLMLGGIFVAGASFSSAAPVGFFMFGVGLALLATVFTSSLQESCFSAPKNEPDTDSAQPQFSGPNISPEDFLFDDDRDKTNLTGTKFSERSYFDWQAMDTGEMFRYPEDFDAIECSYTFGDAEFTDSASQASHDEPNEHDPEVD